jgi:DNA-binding CsgD family transcriptional regulator
MRLIDRQLDEQIAAMTRSGLRQKQIAERLGRPRGFVSRAQQRLGLHAWQGISEEQEKQILALLKQGHGTSKIGKELGVGEYQCRLIAKKYRFKRRKGEPGYRYHLTSAVILRITEDILDRRAPALLLAKKYDVSYKKILKMAHAILKCQKFLSGATKTPLDSDLPQRWPSAKLRRHSATNTPTEEAVLAMCAWLNHQFDGAGLQHPDKFSEVCLLCVRIRSCLQTQNVSTHSSDTRKTQQRDVRAR